MAEMIQPSNGSVSITGHAPSIDQRRNFAVSHMKAARHFAEILAVHEAQHIGAGWGEHYDKCRWLASATIILSVAAIEAAIDETEDDLDLPQEFANAICKATIRDRVQALLIVKNCELLDNGAEPTQSAELLRAIRNALVNPRAEWDSAKKKNKSLSERIVSAQLPLSPFEQSQDLAFPVGCMSAGVAAWATATASEYINEFRQRLSLSQLM